MPPFDPGFADAPSMTTEEPTASPELSASQIDALAKAIARALARGQSVVVMSEGRILARYLPGEPGAAKAVPTKDEPNRRR